jgi:bacteriocin biosynthesis cyclodehydratase domain-containing protein
MNRPANHRNFRLNRAISWNFVIENETIQIRFPDGDHVTIESHVAEIAQILNALADGREPDTANDLSQEVIDLLMRRHVLIQSDAACTDWLEDMLEYVLAASSRQTTPASLLAEARKHSFSVAGTGWLADVARDACALAGLTVSDPQEQPDRHCIIAVSDRVSYDRFSRLNREACDAGTPIIFFWREVARIVCGPLVLPGESGCFECYRSRVRANIKFAAEFDALARLDDGAAPSLGSPIAEGAARAFIARQLLAVAAGAYHMVEPNTLYSFDTLSLASDRQSFLRTPRCVACGSRRAEPARAIRAVP